MAQRRRGFGRGAVCTMVDRASEWIEDVTDRTPQSAARDRYDHDPNSTDLPR